MWWGRTVCVLSPYAATDTKDETEQETSSPPPTQVCQAEIIHITNIIDQWSNPYLLGTYPKNIKCGYKFIGDPGQRIRLEFRDFDLFYGGAQ